MTRPLLVSLLMGGVLLTGCSAQQVITDPPASPPLVSSSSATPSSAAGSPTAAPTPSASVSVSPLPGITGATPGALASRPGGLPPDQRVSAAPASISSRVEYPDGIQVRIVKVTQRLVTAQGPGALTGQPLTTFTIALTNGAKKPLDLNQVVVSAFYGRPPVLAQAIYEPGVADFATVIAPGGTASTTYAFSIPVDRRSNLTVAVDFNGTHTAAVFTGEVTLETS